MNEYINPNYPVYISYAWTNEGESIVKRLCNLLNDRNIFFLRDNETGSRCLMPYRKRLKDAEEEMGRGSVVFLILGNKYFHSLTCLYELHCVLKNDAYENCIYPILLTDCPNLKYDEVVLSIGKFLKKQYQQLSDKIYMDGKELSDSEQMFFDNYGYLDDHGSPSDIEKLRIFLKNYQRKMNPEDLSNVVNDVFNYVLCLESGAVNSCAESDKVIRATSKRVFAYNPDVSNLVRRPGVTSALYELFNTDDIVNIIGMGGIGKTSVSNLFVSEYASCFNNIAHIVINGDVYDEFSLNFGHLLNLSEKSVDCKIVFRDIVNFFKSISQIGEKKNLLVMDVNETANYAQVEGIVDYMRQINLTSWKILVVSRVKIKSDLVEFDPFWIENNDIELSKKIFYYYLKGKGHLYKFSDLEFRYLFESVFFLPLLIEQIAKFLLRQKKVYTNDSILEYIKGDSSSYNNLRTQRVNSIILTEKRKIEYEIVQIFLSNLLDFSQLDSTFHTGTLLRDIVRHLMLWPANYYSVDFIFSMITGVVPDKMSLEIGLSYLCDQCVVEYIDGKGYKMHGLMAEAFRNQVLGECTIDYYSDYSKFLENIRNGLSSNSFNEEQKKCIVSCFINNNITDKDYSIYEDESFFLEIAQMSIEKTQLYEKAYKIKWLRMLYHDIQSRDIWSYLLSYKDKSSVHVYYNWVVNNHDFLLPIDEYTSCGDPVIDEIVSDMVKVCGGEAKLGKLANINNPFHVVHIPDFYISKYQVSQRVWFSVMGYNNSSFRSSAENNPVECVSWYECIDFVIKLTKATRLFFTLPTDDQWEYAARGGLANDNYEYSGSDISFEVAWHRGCSGKHSHPVDENGGKKPNALGLYNMSGNVWEWCIDWYKYKSHRVRRGGSWASDKCYCSITYRYDYGPYRRCNDIGFRLVLVPDVRDVMMPQ